VGGSSSGLLTWQTHANADASEERRFKIGRYYSELLKRVRDQRVRLPQTHRFEVNRPSLGAIRALERALDLEPEEI
jgi:hypothetical protein